MDKFIERPKQAKITNEEINNLDCSISIREI